MAYCSAIKNNEILPFETTQMHLKGIMLSERSQTKTNIVRSHMWNIKQTQKESSGLVVARVRWAVGGGGENG